MKARSLKLNAVLNGIRQTCSILFPLITFPYVSRILGSDGYGKYSFSQSITSYFILLAGLGISTYAIREGAKIRDDKRSVTTFCSQIFSINVCSSLISMVLLAGMVFVIPKINSYAIYIFIESTAIIMSVIGTNWVNSIYEDYLYLTIRYIVVQIIALVAMFIFVRTSKDVIAYCIISVLATNGGNLINIFYVRRYVKIKFSFEMDLKKHVLPLLVLFVNSIAITIYVNSDITMLGFFETDVAVGIYSFSSKIYNILKQLINAVIVVSVPRISYILNNQHDKYDSYMNKIFATLTIILLPITAGMFCMSDSMILIAGGESYIAGNVALKILSVATLFAIYASLFTNCVLIVNRQEKKCLKATMCSAIVNVTLNLILLPMIGMLGAAITTVIAEFINFVIQVKYSKPYFDLGKLDFRQGISCVAGTGAICLICTVCNRFLYGAVIKMIASVVLSTIAYGVILIVMKNKYMMVTIRQMRIRLKR